MLAISNNGLDTKFRVTLSDEVETARRLLAWREVLRKIGAGFARSKPKLKWKWTLREYIMKHCFSYEFWLFFFKRDQVPVLLQSSLKRMTNKNEGKEKVEESNSHREGRGSWLTVKLSKFTTSVYSSYIVPMSCLIRKVEFSGK